jgi:hypothetical protein
MPVIIVDSTVNRAALRAVKKKVRLHCQEREWNCFLSLRDPAALPAGPPHEIFVEGKHELFDGGIGTGARRDHHAERDDYSVGTVIR